MTSGNAPAAGCSHNRERRAATLMRQSYARGPDPCEQQFTPPRTYAPPAFTRDVSGRDLIPLTTAGSRRLFNLHVPVAHPDTFREHWSDWRRYRQAAARKSHYARRLKQLPDAGSPRAGPACPASSLLPRSAHGARDRRGPQWCR